MKEGILTVQILETLDYHDSSRKRDFYPHYDGPVSGADDEYTPRLNNDPREYHTHYVFKNLKKIILDGDTKIKNGDVKIEKEFNHFHSPEIRSHHIALHFRILEDDSGESPSLGD